MARKSYYEVQSHLGALMHVANKYGPMTPVHLSPLPNQRRVYHPYFRRLGYAVEKSSKIPSRIFQVFGFWLAHGRERSCAYRYWLKSTPAYRISPPHPIRGRVLNSPDSPRLGNKLIQSAAVGSFLQQHSLRTTMFRRIYPGEGIQPVLV